MLKSKHLEIASTIACCTINQVLVSFLNSAAASVHVVISIATNCTKAKIKIQLIS